MSRISRRRRRAMRRAATKVARREGPRRGSSQGATIDFGDPVVAGRWKRRSLAAMLLGCAAGIGWYAADPGIASYQVGVLLALPGIITAIVWVGKRLPRWLDWVIASLLVAGGWVGYIAFDGAGWWLWAQLAFLPFVLLVVLSGAHGRGPNGPQPERWYGGMQDGPWGPP